MISRGSAQRVEDAVGEPGAGAGILLRHLLALVQVAPDGLGHRRYDSNANSSRITIVSDASISCTTVPFVLALACGSDR